MSNSHFGKRSAVTFLSIDQGNKSTKSDSPFYSSRADGRAGDPCPAAFLSEFVDLLGVGFGGLQALGGIPSFQAQNLT